MGDTPRTDAKAHRVHFMGDEGEVDYEAVDANLARELERDLQGLVDVCDIEIRERQKLDGELAEAASKRRAALLMLNELFLYPDGEAPLSSTIVTRSQYELLVEALKG